MARIRFLRHPCRRLLTQRLMLSGMALLALLMISFLTLWSIRENVWNLPLQRGTRQEVWYTAPPDPPVSEGDLFTCVRRWLQTDGVPADTVLPFVVIPLTLELDDFRQFMCRVKVHAAYVYVILNGKVQEMTQLLADLRAAVPSERLIIKQHPSNIGYAGAVNEGYRAALAKPYAEVPFVAVFNCDVYFEDRYFTRYLPDVYAALAPDAARADALQAEVQKEEVEAKAAGRSTLRSHAADIAGLSLSYALPDRIRYATFEDQRMAFRQHVGMFHFHYQCMCAFLVSRLALLAGGFLDENCYPAYFEDYDWKFRLSNLGFRTFIGPSERYGGFYHGLGGNIRVINEGPKGRSLSYDLEAARVSRMLVAKPGVDYGEAKWAWHREALEQISLIPFPKVDFVMPVDAWILDKRRQQRIVEIGRGVRPAVEMRDTYNFTLLNALQPFDPRKK